MGRIYFLDLSTLLTYFKSQALSCVLKTSIKARNVTGYVVINKGEFMSSLVIDMRGNTISTDQEYEGLWQSNEWEVVSPSEIPAQLQYRNTEPLPPPPRMTQSLAPAPRMTQSLAPAPRMAQPLAPAPRMTQSLAPAPRMAQPLPSEPVAILLRRKRDLSDWELNDLSVRQRMQLRTVLTMINGQRTSDQLKASIHLPGQLIDEILYYLFCIDAIE